MKAALSSHGGAELPAFPSDLEADGFEEEDFLDDEFDDEDEELDLIEQRRAGKIIDIPRS